MDTEENDSKKRKNPFPEDSMKAENKTKRQKLIADTEESYLYGNIEMRSADIPTFDLLRLNEIANKALKKANEICQEIFGNNKEIMQNLQRHLNGL